jgi:acyl-CoA thioester hydrolase
MRIFYLSSIVDIAVLEILMSAHASVATPLIGYRDLVKPEWIDRNDHLNSMHYKTITDSAMRALFAFDGLTHERLEAEKKSIFQLEMHICYEREMRLGQPFEIRSWLIAVDEKRLHHFREIMQTADNFRAATVELMTIYIDRTTRALGHIPASDTRKIPALAAALASTPLPKNVSRRIGM